MDEDQPSRKLYRRVVRAQVLESHHLDWNSSSGAWENSWALTKGRPCVLRKHAYSVSTVPVNLCNGAYSFATLGEIWARCHDFLGHFWAIQTASLLS